MNDRTAGAVLLVIGAVATFAAIVGGGIKIQQIEIGSVPSKWRQWLLGAFGLVIGFVGLIMVLPDDKPADEATNVQVVDENASVTDENAATPDANVEEAAANDGNSTDENAADTTATDANAGEADPNQAE